MKKKKRTRTTFPKTTRRIKKARAEIINQPVNKLTTQKSSNMVIIGIGLLVLIVLVIILMMSLEEVIKKLNLVPL